MFGMDPLFGRTLSELGGTLGLGLELTLPASSCPVYTFVLSVIHPEQPTPCARLGHTSPQVDKEYTQRAVQGTLGHHAGPEFQDQKVGLLAKVAGARLAASVERRV